MEMGNGNSHHFHTATDTGDYTYGSSNVFYAKRIARIASNMRDRGR